MAAARTAWGRFRLLSQPQMGEREVLQFSGASHSIGRNPERCDVVLDLQYISSVHCVVELMGRTVDGVPIVRLLDKSRNGVWVNGDRVGRGNAARLESGFTIHFTKPGLKAQNVVPKVYKFEAILEEPESKPEPANTTLDLNTSTLGSPVSAQPTTELLSEIPDSKKRRRSNDEVAGDHTDSTVNKLRKRLEDAEHQLAEQKGAYAGSVRALDSARESITQLERQVRALEEEKEQVESAANARIEELTSKWQATAVNHKKQVKAMQQQLSALDNEIAAVKKERDEAKQSAEEAETSLKERNADVVKLKAENSELSKLVAKTTERQDEVDVVISSKNERQQELEAKVEALQRELDASRERISELQYAAQTSANVSAKAAASTSLSRNPTAPASNEVTARLLRQLSAAHRIFTQIQALGKDGEALIELPADAVEDGSAAAVASPLVQSSAGVIDDEIETKGRPVSPVSSSNVKEDEETETKEEDEPSAPEVADVDEPAAEAAETEHTEKTQGENEAGKETNENNHSDPDSDKSSGSRSTTMDSADVDMEDAE